MSKFVCGCIVSAISGILFYMLTIERINLTDQDSIILLINYCEVELPLTQSCKLVAVPKGENDG